jgi:NAD(P)-dependent dehydrogenase (short-subunit alcohol dehydrogenase family)
MSPVTRMSRLDGSVVAVTGAARGVGAELARRLAARGARVALLGLEPQELGAVSAELPGSRAWEVDVTDPAATAAVAEQVVEHFGRVDVLVVNAGIAAGGPLLLSDAAHYDRVIEVNLLGSVRTVRAFLPHLVASRGYVLQVASLAALAAAPMMSAYCASKSGVEAFAHSLRGEVAHHGVRVGVAYLTWTDTDMVRGADERAGLGDMRARLPWLLGRTYPLGPAVERLVGGIERRSAHVYAQRWVRGVPWLRGALPSVLGRPRARDRRSVEDAVRSGTHLTHPVGAGGLADTTRPRR